MVMSVAWSPDGTRLASGGGDRGSGEIFIWEVPGGERLQTLSEPSAIVYALAWNPTAALLLSGSSDGTLRWWDVPCGELLPMRHAHLGAIPLLSVRPRVRWPAS